MRIFVPAGDERLEVTGIVEHSRTGQSEHFRGTEGLVDAVLHQLELDESIVLRELGRRRPSEARPPGRGTP